jgi:hypothetical protein
MHGGIYLTKYSKNNLRRFFFVVKGPAADATDAPQPWGLLCNPVMKMILFFFVFPCNGAPVEWNWQGKTEVLGVKPVPVPLCPPQIRRGLARDRTRASAVKDRRQTAWAMARPTLDYTLLLLTPCRIVNWHQLSLPNHVFAYLDIIATLKMEVACSSETSLLTYDAARCKNPEDYRLMNTRHESPKTYIKIVRISASDMLSSGLIFVSFRE